MCWPWCFGCGGAGVAYHAVPAVGLVAFLPLFTFVFIPKGSVARIIVPIAGAVGVLTVVFAVPNAKDEE